MIIKHISAGADENPLVFLAQSPRGTVLYDYSRELFLFVQGFSLVGPYRCVYDRDSVQESQSLHKVFYLLYPKEWRNLDAKEN